MAQAGCLNHTANTCTCYSITTAIADSAGGTVLFRHDETLADLPWESERRLEVVATRQ